MVSLGNLGESTLSLKMPDANADDENTYCYYAILIYSTASG